jgi:hypothetical protein
MKEYKTKTTTCRNIIILVSITLAACTTTTPPPQIVEKPIYIKVPLSLPAKPTLPTLNSNDVSCLPTKIKQKLVERDSLRKNYIEQLELIIKSTQEK